LKKDLQDENSAHDTARIENRKLLQLLSRHRKDVEANAARHRSNIHDKKEELSSESSDASEEKKKIPANSENSDILRIVDSEIALHLSR
jgi:hypothetical protein